MLRPTLFLKCECLPMLQFKAMLSIPCWWFPKPFWCFAILANAFWCLAISLLVFLNVLLVLVIAWLALASVGRITQIGKVRPLFHMQPCLETVSANWNPTKIIRDPIYPGPIFRKASPDYESNYMSACFKAPAPILDVEAQRSSSHRVLQRHWRVAKRIVNR